MGYSSKQLSTPREHSIISPLEDSTCPARPAFDPNAGLFFCPACGGPQRRPDVRRHHRAPRARRMRGPSRRLALWSEGGRVSADSARSETFYSMHGRSTRRSISAQRGRLNPCLVTSAVLASNGHLFIGVILLGSVLAYVLAPIRSPTFREMLAAPLEAYGAVPSLARWHGLHSTGHRRRQLPALAECALSICTS